MKQNHYLAEDVDAGIGTQAHWSTATPTSVIVFVHGFCGKAVGTWTDFPTVLLGDDRAATTDVVFYGYDGKTSQAANSAERLLKFLDDLALQPWTLTKGVGRSRKDPPYRSILIAAHSLGAVITRRALLNAAKDAKPWITRARFVLFAPAHNGAHAAVLASGFLSEQDWYLGKIAAKALQYHVPLISDLTPGSTVLNKLLTDTEKALATNPRAAHLVAHTVVWAADERVVINERYLDDCAPVELPGDHAAICKPTLGFIEPKELLLAALQEATQ